MNYIYFDLLCAQPFGGIKFHGGGEYTKAVFKQLSELIGSDSYLLTVFYNFDLYLDDWILEIVKEKGVVAVDVKSYHEIASHLNNLDSYDNATFYTGLVNQYNNIEITDKVRTIGTCHGLRQLEKDFDILQYFYVNSLKDVIRVLYYHLNRNRLYKQSYELYKNCLSKFQNIITVSNHSQYSIKSTFGDIFREKGIRTLYTPSKIYNDSPVAASDENYIMMVSADRWIKNSYRGVLALDALYSKGLMLDMKTRVYGNLPRPIKKKIKNPELFEFYEYVSSYELEKAYSQCSIFFYPTLNEGFGMPPLEAQKYGKTCVISAVASLTEIYGDSVYYCNPYDVQEMSTRLLEAYSVRITTEKVLDNVKRISNKQDIDLVNVANFILGY